MKITSEMVKSLVQRSGGLNYSTALRLLKITNGDDHMALRMAQPGGPSQSEILAERLNRIEDRLLALETEKNPIPIISSD